MTQRFLTYDELQLSPPDVYQQMGYGTVQPDASVCQETARIIDEVRRWLRPAFCYFVDPALPPSFAVGDVISRRLRGSLSYAFFIATAGTLFEQYQQHLKQQDDLVRTYIADALGSCVAEKCADVMELHLQASIDRLGWHHTNRFSPGYCGWHVSQQQLLFPLFSGQTCGVQLNDSSLMVPIKSVSGIVGVGPAVRHTDYTCGLCDYHDCYKRRRGRIS